MEKKRREKGREERDCPVVTVVDGAMVSHTHISVALSVKVEVNEYIITA